MRVNVKEGDPNRNIQHLISIYFKNVNVYNLFHYPAPSPFFLVVVGDHASLFYVSYFYLPPVYVMSRSLFSLVLEFSSFLFLSLQFSSDSHFI